MLKRAVARLPRFQKDGDYDAFECVLAEALAEHPTRLLASCVLPNHGPLVLWPQGDNHLTDCVRWLTHPHALRRHAHYHTGGTGHLSQGRCKAFPVAADEHRYAVLRYVERNPLCVNQVARAQAWRWSRLGRRQRGDAKALARLHLWPLPLPADWPDLVNTPHTEAELAALRQAVVRAQPYGPAAWCVDTARRLGLEACAAAAGPPAQGRPTPEAWF